MHTLEFYVGPDVFTIWGEVKGLIHKAAEHSRGEWRASDVLIAVQDGRQHLWVGRKDGRIQGVMVTSLDVHPRKTVCTIYAMSGYGVQELWEQYSKHLIVWLEAHHVDEVQAVCRDDVMEKFLNLGFVKTANMLSFKWKETP